MSNDITVTVPARPEHVRILRLLVSSVAARLDLTTDRIEELKLAVDEASGTLLSLEGGAGVLRMRILPESDIRVEVASDGRPGAEAWPPPDLESTLGWRILSGLAKDATFEMTEEGPTIIFTMRGVTGG